MSLAGFYSRVLSRGAWRGFLEYESLLWSITCKKAVSAWINTKYCPECGRERAIEHEPGCLFPLMMQNLEVPNLA